MRFLALRVALADAAPRARVSRARAFREQVSGCRHVDYVPGWRLPWAVPPTVLLLAMSICQTHA